MNEQYVTSNFLSIDTALGSVCCNCFAGGKGSGKLEDLDGR